MFPQTFSESAQEAAERQTNYLILRSLEEKLPSDLFQQILNQMSVSLTLPKRIGWDGVPSDTAFAAMKVSHPEVNSSFLPRLLQGSLKETGNHGSQLPESIKNSYEKNLSYFLKQLLTSREVTSKNIYAQLNSKMGRFGSISSQMVGAPSQDRNKMFAIDDLANMDRMKTVFCHADFNTNEVSSIFNVCFDRSGKFIVSGADDGIIKVWDRDTLTLQASLHGHQDFITIIEVSRCNRFIASAGNDAALILWDLASGKLLHKFTNHTSLINRLTFFSPKQQPNQRLQQQYLFSCSDDGTVQLQDLTALSIPKRSDDDDLQRVSHPNVTQAELDEFQVRRSSRRPSTKNPEEESDFINDKAVKWFNLQLTQSDFRPGQRNKKIDTLCVNNSGLVLAGTNTGELFAWKVYFNRIQERQSYQKTDLQRFIGHYRLFKNNIGIQFTEFCPTNDHLLLIGGTEGQVKVWNTEVNAKDADMKYLDLENDLNRLKVTVSEQEGCIQYSQLKVRVAENEQEQSGDEVMSEYQVFTDRIIRKPIEGPRKILQNIKKSQCDMVKWSCKGRFVIASITTLLDNKEKKEEEKDENTEVCRIKLFDFVNETYVDDLARSSGYALRKNTFMLAPHPTCEELLMTGSDGGQLLLWNLQSLRILKRWTQYGVYSIDSYCMDNPLDGTFSPDGKAFLVGSNLGTISLFAHKALTHQYESTRVQQFFPYDIDRQKENLFEKCEKQPQICGFNMIPYEVQPQVPLIGPHAKKESLASTEPPKEERNIRQELKHVYEEFERGLAVAKELGKQEARYYEDQIQAGVGEIFNVNVLGNPAEAASEVPQEQLIQDEVVRLSEDEVRRPADTQQADSEIADQPRASRRLTRTDQVRSPVLRNSQTPTRTRNLRSRPSPVPAHASNNYLMRQLSDESPRLRRRQVPQMMDQVESEEVKQSDDDEVHPHDLLSSLDEHDSDYDSELSQDSFVRRHSRRTARRDHTRRNMWDRSPKKDHQEQRMREDRAQRALRRRNLVDSPEVGGESDEGLMGVKRQRGGNVQLGLAGFHATPPEQSFSRTQRRQSRHALPSENSFIEPISMDDASEQIAIRKSKQRKEQKRRALLSSQETEQRAAPVRTLRGGNIGNESDQSEMQVDSFVVDEEEESSFSAKATPTKDRMGFFNGDKPEVDYQYIENDRKVKELLSKYPSCSSLCAICLRSDSELIGPFVNTKVQCAPLYFHRNCIELSQYSYYRLADNRWVNIGEAMDNLVLNGAYKCERCGIPGATVQCVTCKRCYHGHLCAPLMMLDVSTSGASQILPKKRKMQCLFCRNKVNYDMFQTEKVPTYDQEQHQDKYLLNAWKKLDRDHLLQNMNCVDGQAAGFVPQLNDIVYYFYQGHEEYTTQYSCFFFAGEEKELRAKDVAPWIAYPQVREENLLLCRVVEIEHDFPKRRAVKLLKKWGLESTNVVQKPELIQQVRLEVITKVRGFSTQKPLTFSVSLFPNQVSDFLVLKEVFEAKLAMFEHSQEKEFNMLGKKTQDSERIKVIDPISPFEPTTQPKSYWKNVVCQQASRYRRMSSEMPQHRSSRRVIAASEDPGTSKRINFWDLDFELEDAQTLQLKQSLSAFNEDERVKLVSFLEEFLDKKKELCLFFKNRVTEEIASDYRSIVPTDMYLSLILDRLINHYYRDQQQLFADLDLISHNSQSYNGDKNEITEEAEALVESIRNKIRPLINDKAETALAKKMQLAQIIRSQYFPKGTRTGKETAPLKPMSSDQILEQYDRLAREEEKEEEVPGQEVKMGFSGMTSNHEKSDEDDKESDEEEEEDEEDEEDEKDKESDEEDKMDQLEVHQTRQPLKSEISASEVQSMNSSRRPRQNGGTDSHLGQKRNRSQLSHSCDKSDNEASAVSGRLRQRNAEDVGPNKRQHLI